VTPDSVLDSSVAIDLKRGDLLEAFFKLPTRFIVPDIMFTDELDWFADTLRELGLVVEALDDGEITAATEFMRRRRGLSIYDAYAMALAAKKRCTLLAGAKDLRELGAEVGIEVRGVLHALDMIEEAQILSPASLHTCLYTMCRSRRVRLPEDEVQARLTRYAAGAGWAAPANGQ
jgi:hypothetical protein